MSKLRFVLDTNLVISAALLETSLARKAFDIALAQGEILLSQAVQAELSDIFMRTKFDRYVSPVHRLQFLANLIAISTSIQIIERIEACRDPQDDKLLELAVNGKADCLVTGDKDLLVLHPFRGIPILAPNDFSQGYSLSA